MSLSSTSPPRSTRRGSSDGRCPATCQFRSRRINLGSRVRRRINLGSRVRRRINLGSRVRLSVWSDRRVHRFRSSGKL
eukprot:2888710-Pyramimonas_sp.AAC.1